MEEQRQDTPQQANPNDVSNVFGAPVEESSQNTPTIEEAFFGPTEAQQEGTPQSHEQAPQVQETPATEQENQSRNDEKRFEYWQSQAAKRENEIAALKQQIGQKPAQPQVPMEATEPKVEEFPPPPSKPSRPRTFSREEAWNDTASESAKYLDDVDGWQDEMTQYNELKHQYDMALMQERYDKVDGERKKDVKLQQNRQAQKQQAREIVDYVQGHHGFNPEEATDFVQTMSNNDAITMDNLVALYRLKKGQPVNTGQPQPSAEFQQTQNAQQVPSPMGVMPATGQSGRTDTDQIMDDLIGTHNSKNPWR
tara:strand:+ start:265 stop:1191 length:927 start_codon:yes stop_codon:yes gene_type:complete